MVTNVSPEENGVFVSKSAEVQGRWKDCWHRDVSGEEKEKVRALRGLTFWGMTSVVTAEKWTGQADLFPSPLLSDTAECERRKDARQGRESPSEQAFTAVVDDGGRRGQP